MPEDWLRLDPVDTEKEKDPTKDEDNIVCEQIAEQFDVPHDTVRCIKLFVVVPPEESENYLSQITQYAKYRNQHADLCLVTSVKSEIVDGEPEYLTAYIHPGRRTFWGWFYKLFLRLYRFCHPNLF